MKKLRALLASIKLLVLRYKQRTIELLFSRYVLCVWSKGRTKDVLLIRMTLSEAINKQNLFGAAATLDLSASASYRITLTRV